MQTLILFGLSLLVSVPSVLLLMLALSEDVT